MERIKKGLGNLGVVLALAAGLAGLGCPALVRNTRHCGRAGSVACTDTPGPARNRAVADGSRKPPAALGRFRRHRGRDSGVVGVLVALLAMAEGFEATLSTRDDASAIVVADRSPRRTRLSPATRYR